MSVLTIILPVEYKISVHTFCKHFVTEAYISKFVRLNVSHIYQTNVLEIYEINYILLYIQQMQRYTVYLYLETALHVSGGTSTHHQEHIQLYLQHLVFVTPLLLPAAIAAGSNNVVTNTRCCRYSCMCS